MVKKLLQLRVSQVCPAVLAGFNLDARGAPDCGKVGVAPDVAVPVFKGKTAAQRKQATAKTIPARTTGLGSYTRSSDDRHPRIPKLFEYTGDPVGRDDGRSKKCGHPRGKPPLAHAPMGCRAAGRPTRCD